MTNKKLTKRRMKNKKATSIKTLLIQKEKQEIKIGLQTTTALDLLFQQKVLNEECVLAGKQYALIKYKRPVGGPSDVTSNLEAQLLPGTKEKKLWVDHIVNDNLEDIWRESQKIVNRISPEILEKITVDNSIEKAKQVAENKKQLAELNQVLSALALLYRHHKSTKFLLDEIT